MPDAKKVLIVDDEPDLVALTSFRLRKAGYIVSSVLDGAKALEEIKSSVPSLILLDLNLPGMSGEQICGLVKADDALRNIPILLFSASSDNIEDRCRDMGADDFLVKPYEHEDLLAKVRQLLEQK